MHEAWSQGRTGGRNSQSTVRVQRNFVGTHGARPELRFTRLKRYSATVMLYKKFNEPFATNPGTSETIGSAPSFSRIPLESAHAFLQAASGPEGDSMMKLNFES